MMHINVQIEDSGVNFEHFNDGQHTIIYIAKPTCLLPLCMMEPSTPVDENLRALVVELEGAENRAGGVELAEIVELGVDWVGTVGRETEAVELVLIHAEIVFIDVSEQVNVLF